MNSDELKQKLNANYAKIELLKTMGIRVESFDTDRAILTIACDDNTTSPYGSLYGGVVSFAADIAIWNALLTRGENPRVATTDLNVHYLERFPKGRARFEARILKYGSRLIIGECDVFNQDNVMAAHVTASFLKLDRKSS